MSFHCGQCSIGPQSSFEYRFTAEPAGTFFYHSHVPYQMGDGVFGAFIVQDPDNDPYYADGQMIAQDVVIGLSDWMRYTSDTVYQFVSQFRVDIWPLSHCAKMAIFRLLYKMLELSRPERHGNLVSHDRR